MNKTIAAELFAVRQELTRLGLLEDSGARRPNRDGSMAVVWRTTHLGHLVHEYERRGLPFEQALAKAKSQRVG